MKIKNAQAGLVLRNVVVTELSIKNQLAAHGKFDSDTHEIDMDYDVVEVNDGDDGYSAKLELITKITINNNRATVFRLKVKHLGLLAAPKAVYPTAEEFVKAVELNGLASLVSFARSSIASITGVTFCQGNVIIPMVNIFKLQQLKEESKAQA